MGPCDEVDGSFRPLADAVREAARTGEPVRLAAVTDFEWDRVYAFPPYWGSDEISDSLEFDWDGESKDNDGYGLLVFVEDGEVVHAYDHSISDTYLVCIDVTWVRGGLTPTEAVLRVTRHDEDGGTWYFVSLAQPRDAREARRTKRCLRTYS